MPDFSFLTQTATLPWILGAAILFSLGLVIVLAGLTALFGLHPLRFITRTLLGLLLITLGILEATITLGIQGYRALTQEELAARISVKPYAPQKFTAKLTFPDGREESYTLAGDEIYLDARILKWRALANMMGLSTAYELDRIGGRYRDVEQEKSAPRSLYALGRDKPVDLFALTKRFPFLEHVVDAKYGSAAFVPVGEPADIELLVSTTGLLIRPAAPKPVEPAKP
jgi:hypothetical protein